ncbi:MAG: ABC transporter permease, partial [Gemmatimonadales bacterium]|nr:ABC transporter permease [Gemmatimonadales bacterium]
VAIGSAAGLAAAVGIGTAMRSLLFSIGAGDPATLIGAAVLLAGVGLAAAFLPAWRASHLDPVRALRSE